MLEAFGRLFLITAITVIGVVFAVFGLRTLGLQARYQALDNPILRRPFLVIANGGGSGEAPSDTSAAFDHAAALNPKLGVEVHLRITQDKKWVLYPSPYLQALTEKTGIVRATNLADLQKLDAGYRFRGPDGRFPYRGKGLHVLTLQEYLKRYPKMTAIFNIYSDDEHSVDELITVLKAHQNQLQNNVVLYSTDSNIMDQIRKALPMWALAADTAAVGKAAFFNGLYLETVIELPFDVYFSAIDSGRIPHIDERLAKELRRRQRRIFLMVNNLSIYEKDPARSFLDGIITAFPSRFVSLLHPQMQSH